jgi:hypothetical protein
MKRSLLSMVLGFVAVFALVAQVPAVATDVGVRRLPHQSAQVEPAHWVSFHARLGSGKRADCRTTGRAAKLYLRCDRYDKQSGQELSVTIVGGKAQRLVNPSDAIGDPVGRKLRADETWRRGAVRCRATGTSLRCRDVNTGHGFVVKAHLLRVM